MKKKVVLFFIFISAAVFSQTYKEGMGFGFGITSPRMFGDTYAEYMNFGAHFSFQKDFDEVNIARVKLDYLTFTSSGAPLGLPAKGPSNTSAILAFDYLYRFSACHALKLYFGTGFSALFFTLKNATKGIESKSYIGEIGVNFIVGGTYALSKEWDLCGEFAMHQTSTDRFDGVYSPGGGLFGGTLDSYITSEFGAVFYFDRGEETKYCETPGGITNIFNQNTPSAAPSIAVDYSRIRQIVGEAKTMPAQIDYKKIEEIVDEKINTALKSGIASSERVVFVGINFEPNDASIKTEEYAILAQDLFMLLSHPDIKVEIAGYTDRDGTEKANLTLSNKRATNVRDYLVAKGVDASRLAVKGYGAEPSVSEIKAFNRRVEFKILK